MTGHALLSHLQQTGCLISLVGSELEIDAPDEVLTDELIGELRAHKSALLDLLRQPTPRHTLADRVVIIRAADAPAECWLCAGVGKTEKLHPDAEGLLRCRGCGWRFVVEAPEVETEEAA